VFKRAASLWNRLTHRPASGALAEEDRRLWVRRHVSVETRVTPATGEAETPLPARILDVSSGGARLEVGRFFEPGDLLSLELPPQDGSSSVTVLACVVYSQAVGDDRHILGCRFSAELSAADLATFGASKTRPDVLDSRNWSRYPCEIKAVYQTVPDDDKPPREAKVLNISAGGIGLVVTEEVRAGALLSAELHAADGRAVVTILACVVHVVAESGRERVLGCNFIQELSEKDLEALA
jgi:c-di-GMP-binding flagellar brake protein YcgR